MRKMESNSRKLSTLSQSQFFLASILAILTSFISRRTMRKLGHRVYESHVFFFSIGLMSMALSIGHESGMTLRLTVNATVSILAQELLELPQRTPAATIVLFGAPFFNRISSLIDGSHVYNSSSGGLDLYQHDF